MDLGLNGKVAIVTGAGSVKGFGRAIATTLASEGCDLVVNDMRLDWAEKVAEEIRASGRKAVAVRADVASKEEVDSMAARALETFGRIDILVNNAGTMSGSGTSLFIDSRKEEWDREIDVNLKGVLNCCHAVVKHMVGRKSGKIVNIASGAGKSGAPRCVAYSASKGGVIALTKALALEVCALGINVNSVAPGMAETGLFDYDKLPPAFMERLKKTSPSGRLTQPKDVANMVAFLSSDVASDIVGQCFSVDGGSVMM